MNGVCVVWKGWIDLQRLDGAGYLEFDEDKAKVSHYPYINNKKTLSDCHTFHLIQVRRM